MIGVNTVRAQLIANVRTRIQVNRVTHVKRSLVGEGKLTVRVGEEVHPQDILGRSFLSAGFSAVNIAKMLNVLPSEGGRYIQRPTGKVIYRGELLALKKGIFGQKIVRAPTDGLIEAYDVKTGELRLQFLSKEIPLTAGIIGIVDNVSYVTNEVTIKTMATEVFGILGSGKERGGILNILGAAGDLVNPFQIRMDMHQHIILAGSLVESDILRKATGFGLSGIICGGVNVSDYRAIMGSVDPTKRIGTDVGISLVITEGFGLIPMGSDIFSLMRPYDGKFIFINGNTNQVLLPTLATDSILTLRKISLPIEKIHNIAPEIVLGEINIGDRVRLIWPPFMGVQGKVISIDETPTLLESGISTILLTIETAKQKLKIPYTNIEIIK